MVGITTIEQSSLLMSFKLFIYSEFMLFLAAFGSWFDHSFDVNAIYLSSCFPIFTFLPFSLPFSNLLILVFSSFSIQSSMIFATLGYLFSSLDNLSTTMGVGYTLLVVQLKEFLYTFFSASDGMIGSVFYFTVTLHAIHVFLGIY